MASAEEMRKREEKAAQEKERRADKKRKREEEVVVSYSIHGRDGSWKLPSEPQLLSEMEQESQWFQFSALGDVLDDVSREAAQAARNHSMQHAYEVYDNIDLRGGLVSDRKKNRTAPEVSKWLRQLCELRNITWKFGRQGKIPCTITNHRLIVGLLAQDKLSSRSSP
jgi:hypothetical protein